ncbi:unnamed protein product [Sphagnum troendelagicum]|uniref:cGMP-dependent protein kinase n=1 Tax=Sphagnum troendelagicum TaxID=128251 RepID=A0ABP0TEA0_9BRYO
MSEVSMGLLPGPPGAESTPTSNDPGDLDLIKYMEETLMAIAAFNVQGLKSVMMKLDKESLQDGMTVMLKELDDLFERFNSQQVSVIKKSLQVFAEVVLKSENTKERLRTILSNHYIFRDLENDLREEIVDAFQDIRVSPGTEVIKQGDVADNFYIIDVGDFDILATKGKEPYVLLRSKGAGESFGELAMMYDTTRNATVKSTTNALLWAVDRVTFKAILGEHLTGSSTAQVLREAPAFQKLSTKEIVRLSNNCTIQSFKRGASIFKATSNLDKVCIVQEGQVRVSWGATQGNPVTGKGVIGGETMAFLNRLEVLGEALLLNDEFINSCNYNAATDQVIVIMLDRMLFTKEMLVAIRKGLQIQLISLALQRVPAFLELSFDQLSQLAETFSQSTFAKGKEITRIGDSMGPASRIYVVQSGIVASYKQSIEEKHETVKGETHKEKDGGGSGGGSSSSPGTSMSGWGSKLNSMIKNSITAVPGAGSGNKPQSQSTSRSPSPVKHRPPSAAAAAAAAAAGEGAKLGPDQPNYMVGQTPASTNVSGWSSSVAASTDQLSGDSKARSSIRQSPLTITTYGVFGEECLRGSVKSHKSAASCQTTMVSESKEGVVLLSVSLAEVTTILGPIQEFLSRVANLKVLRKVTCLENLTSSEITMLSHSMGVRRYRPGEPIYRAGDPGDCLYVVHRGTVVETAHDRKGDQIILVKGSTFGEDALMGNEPRVSTMVAGPNEPPSTTGAELYYLDRAVIEANLGPLRDLNETRQQENDKRGIVKSITFEELYEIGILGTGLFGKVKLVYSRRTQEHYALKCVSKAKVARMQEEEHLRNEKIHMSELDHPFITKLIRTFKDVKNVYLLQELTTGRELFLFMERVGRLQEWEAAFYAGAVLLALEYMHSKGIAYRDLKPENTLIGENGYPKLIDMGFAKRIHNRRTFSMCGTPDYMAPEIIKRQGHGKGVDFWALGCMIFEMITNTSPFNRGDDPPQLVFQKITEGRMRFPPYMSANAVDVVKRLLDPNPETRLGCRKFGPAEIKEHPFFTREINFQLLSRQKEEPPMIPPKITDYRKLCIMDDQPEPPENAVSSATSHGEKVNWDDIF